MKSPRIVFVGGGSYAWIPTIVRDMLLTESLRDAEFVLLDLNRDAADLTRACCEKLARHIGAGARFRSTDNRPRALDGARYILITISTGGLDAMAHDIAIPERFGIYHTVGDTSGPGGWARLIRNFDVFVALARDFNRYAPDALILNYTNPMTTLTDVLARLCRQPVVGLCHGLFENLVFLQQFYRLDREEDLAVHYGGLNHFFWITRARAGTVDVLADLQRRLRGRSLTDLIREARPDAMGFTSHREVATELFRLTGVMPYLGDRHTCEFFPCYITRREQLARYRLVRTSVAERKRAHRRRERQLRRFLRDPIPPGWLQRSRETAADIIAAHWGGRSFVDVGNLPNIGQIASLPTGLVVETAMRVDRNGFTPLTFGPLPPLVQGFVEPYARLFPLVVDACFQRNKKLALQALRLDPVCAHLTGAQVIELGEQLLRAHRRFITAF